MGADGLPISWPAWQVATRHLQRRDSREALRIFRATQMAHADDQKARERWVKMEQMNAGHFGELREDG